MDHVMVSPNGGRRYHHDRKESAPLSAHRGLGRTGQAQTVQGFGPRRALSLRNAERRPALADELPLSWRAEDGLFRPLARSVPGGCTRAGDQGETAAKR